MTGMEPHPESTADSTIDRLGNLVDSGSCAAALRSSEPRRRSTVSKDDAGNEWSRLERRLRRRDGRKLRQSSFSRSDSSASNCSGISSGSCQSTSGGPSVQGQVVDQCEVIRERRQFEPLIRWCIREGLVSNDSPVGHVMGSRSTRSSMADVRSDRSTSGLTTISHHQELLSDIVDEGFSDDSDESDHIITSRIPQRFFPSPSSSGLHGDQSTGDAMSTTSLAGALFWKDRRLSGPPGWSLQGVALTATPSRKSCAFEETALPPPTTSARRISSSISRQMAFSFDHVDAATHNGVKRRSYPLQRARSEPTNDTRSAFADYGDVTRLMSSLDVYDEIDSISESDDTGSSDVSDTAPSALDGVDDVMGLKNQLQMIVRLSKTHIPVHFWPQLKTETVRHTCWTDS